MDPEPTGLRMGIGGSERKWFGTVCIATRVGTSAGVGISTILLVVLIVLTRRVAGIQVFEFGRPVSARVVTRQRSMANALLQLAAPQHLNGQEGGDGK